MELVIQLSRDAARAIHQGGGWHEAPATAPLAAVLEQFEVAIEPQHPGVTAPELAAFFTIPEVGAADADALAAALLDLDVVDAAYVQPQAAPP